MPKVSVLTPIYRSNPDYLRQMIESVLNQTFPDFEFILLNDSPDDKNLKRIVESYQDNRIIYAENEYNLGISASQNKLLDMARGEYLAICDHDDISVPTRFEQQVNFLDAHKDIGVVSGQIHYMHCKETTKHPVRNKEIKPALLLGCLIAHPAAMIRKNILLKNGINWDENYSPCEDYKLWADLIDKTLFHNIDGILLEYRDAPNNTTHLQQEKMQEKSCQIQHIISKCHAWIKQWETVQKRYCLFGVPLLKTVSSRKKMTFYLFSFIPFFKIKKTRR